MSTHSFKHGQKVTFSTPGRYPRPQSGTVTGVESGWLTVKCDDGVVRKTKPGMAKPA
jgi:hypothetical protein